MKKKAEEAIRLAVPELQELKVGCILEGWSGNGIVTSVDNKEVLISWDVKMQTSIQLDEFDEDCIIGSEIHLEHVLKAIEWHDYVINSDGDIREMVQVGGYSEYQDLETVVNYNINKPFTEQSEEFYKFIVDILK